MTLAHKAKKERLATRARLGIPVGVYGYFKAVTRAEADRELAFFRSALGGRNFQLPIAVDIEDAYQTARA